MPKLTENTMGTSYYGDDRKPIELPEGKRHGSAWAAMRSNCTCCSCVAKRERMRKKGWRPQV